MATFFNLFPRKEMQPSLKKHHIHLSTPAFRTERLSQGISLEVASHVMRVSVVVIKKIEEGDYNNLGLSQHFLHKLLRSYASFLKIPSSPLPHFSYSRPTPAMNEFQFFKKFSPPPQDSKKSIKTIYPFLCTSVAGIFFIWCLSIKIVARPAPFISGYFSTPSLCHTLEKAISTPTFAFSQE